MRVYVVIPTRIRGSLCANHCYTTDSGLTRGCDMLANHGDALVLPLGIAVFRRDLYLPW